MTSGSAPQFTGLQIGREARVEKEIPYQWTIAYYDATLPPVLSTPAMIGMMELAAEQAVRPALPAGAITVGTRIEVEHLKAVPPGARVMASARLVEINGRFLGFDVEARSGEELIGRGRVFRAIVERERFFSKAAARAKP